jgi:ATP-binding cassette ChvD family protein
MNCFIVPKSPSLLFNTSKRASHAALSRIWTNHRCLTICEPNIHVPLILGGTPDIARQTLSRTRNIIMAAYQYVYHMQGVSKTYPGGKKCFENIHLNFLPGVKIGVVGVNGAGKSTLMKIMAGMDKDFTGEAWVAEGAKVGYLPQEPKLDASLTVRENVMLGVARKMAILDRYNELAMNYSDETADEMAALQDQIDAENLWDLDSQIDVSMEALRCPPDDADISKLSGGELRRVALCKLLLEAPEMLLLDEPTNHLDAETIAWLQQHLIAYKGTILIVTHDRYFLDDITTWILELDRGRGIPNEGNYSDWLEQKAKRLSQESREDKSRQKILERELEWMRQGAKARQAKSKARINAYNDMADQSEREKLANAQIVIPNGQRLGSKVIEVAGLTKAMGDKLLVENLNFSLPPGGIVGVIGPNGAGKSTLFKMLTGQEMPDSGTVEIGDTVELSYVDQSRDDLKPDDNVWQAITGGAELIALGDAEVNSRAYCSSFNFKGSDQQKKVGLLSGGERNRVHMARLLKSGGNVLLLDEPTNDLDVETLRALEDALVDFAGCAVVISHDRFFLDRICTHILAFEGEAHVEWFEGNFADYEEDKRRRLGADAMEPKRLKHKKFMR